mgnify:FL=1
MELKRPRIDVTARISGLFRDTMPSVMQVMDKAVLLAAEQDEPDDLNFVRKHIQEDTRELEQQEGMEHAAAWRQAASASLAMSREPMAQALRRCWKARTGKPLMILPMFMYVGAVMPMAAKPR